MKNKAQILKICAVLIFNLTWITSCSTNPLLTENVVVNTPKQVQLEKEVQRASNNITYPSNLSNFNYPSFEQLSHEANIKDEKLFIKNSKVLSDWILRRISYKQKRQLAKNCESLVGDFGAQFPLDETTIACAAWWIEKKNAPTVVIPNAQVTSDNSVGMTTQQRLNWMNYKGMSISQILPLLDLDTQTNQNHFIELALKHGTDCTLLNASSALILKLENYLPDIKIYNDIEKVYAKIDKCLVPNQEPSEKIHLRIGLLRLLYGKPEPAFLSLKKTQLETDPKENSRNLFWLGVIFKKDHPLVHSNPYWTQLLLENPLSLGALVARQQLGQNQLDFLLSDDKISLQNRVEGGWTKENVETFVFDLLISQKKKDSANIWANMVTQNLTTSNPNMLLYWAVTQNKLSNFYNSIVVFSKYTRIQKEPRISKGLLAIQFPTPFLQQILTVKNNVDPLLVLALMRQESAFDINAHSGANARGLMQILPNTARQIQHGVHAKQLYDPELNVKIGSAFLERLFKKYDGKSEYVLAAYNAGTVNLDKWLTRVPIQNTMLFCDFIPFRETRNYISIILRNYYWYSVILSQNTDKLSQNVLKKSELSLFKSNRVQSLLTPLEEKKTISQEQNKDLDPIYVFGMNENAMTMN